MHKVIFDTNTIRNAESLSDFLGGRSELERFSKVAEIIIPEIVIEEIRNQKRRHLVSKRDAFLDNPFHALRNLDENETKNFDIDDCIMQLESGERISYSLINLTNATALEEIKALCLGNTPPFEKNTDKGFKDAFIYLTIIEYLNNNPEQKMFFVTKDNLLKDAFNKNNQVTVVGNYDEFEQYIDDYFREEYFINKLKEQISENITNDSIKEIWLNINENWVLTVSCDENTYLIEVDFTSREIIDYITSDFAGYVKMLEFSGAFHNTHSCISELINYSQYLSDDEIQRLLEAAVTNDQIYRISSDEDVKDFFLTIYEAKSQLVSEEIKEQFKQRFG